MPLKSARFASNPRLQSASANSPVMKMGERGEAVMIVQKSLIDLGFAMPASTPKGKGIPDGIYGGETAGTVQQFQRQHALQPDGIVGRNTLAQLDDLFCPGKARPGGEPCANCFQAPGPKVISLTEEPAADGHSLATTSQGFSSRATSLGVSQTASAASAIDDLIEQLKKMKMPKELRPLDSVQRKLADYVFGKSLDYSKILISDGVGFSGRAFVTVATIEIFGVAVGFRQFKGFTIMNLGTFSPSRKLFLHELTHVWQSQHHPVKHQFMINAVQSQALAEEARANGLKTASAYAAEPPGRPWGQYAAEQNAGRVEAELAAALAHVRAAKKNVTDAENEASLAQPRFGIR